MSYRIGEFARLSGVSVKTLRFYDQVGILRPARIDPRTRYRFYTAQQLQDIALARVLRASGMPLAEVKRLLRKRAASEQRAALESLQTTLRETLAQTQRSLFWIDSLLLTEDRAAIPISMKRRAAVQVASLRSEVDAYSDVARMQRELQAIVPARRRGAFRAVLWHRCAGEGALDAEPFVELRGNRGLADVTVSCLPATMVACAYAAPDDTAAENAYSAVREWMDVFGFERGGPKCEIDYVNMLEIQFPVHKAEAPEATVSR